MCFSSAVVLWIKTILRQSNASCLHRGLRSTFYETLLFLSQTIQQFRLWTKQARSVPGICICSGPNSTVHPGHGHPQWGPELEQS